MSDASKPRDSATGAGRTFMRATLPYASNAFELLLLLPVWLALFGWLAPYGAEAAWLALAPAASFLGVAAGRWLGRRWQQLAVAAMAAAAAAYAAASAGADWRVVAAAGAVGGFAPLQGMTIGERASDARWHWAGLGLYFVAAVLFPRLDALQASVPLLTAAGAVCLAVALRRHNRLLMGALLLVAAGLTAAFGNAFGKLLYALLRGLFALLPAGEPEAPPPAEAPPPPAMEGLPEPAGEPGLLFLILDILGYAVGALAALALLTALGIWLYRHAGSALRAWLRRLASFLARPTRAPEEAAYTDEESGVFSWEAVGRRMRDTWIGRLLSREREPRWEELRTNRDRVRWLYRSWLRAAAGAGHAPSRASTPREAAEAAARAGERRPGAAAAGVQALAELYDRVRYGEEDASDEAVERLRRETVAGFGRGKTMGGRR